MEIIGRKAEIQRLEEIMARDQPAFLAVYGRRRVGKTFLIRNFFQNKFAFNATGLANSPTKAQLLNFSLSINESFGASYKPFKSWLEAFAALRFCLSKIKGNRVVFLDELPWFDTRKSDFLTGLENFWNSWAGAEPGLKLIVCGSATSWMIHELIRNKGGLYNRVTHRMKLEPFTLHEVERFLQSKGLTLDRYQVIQLYMVVGGIPFYLEQVKQGLSIAQNIEKICFQTDGLLRSEFQFIFSSLFSNGEKHEALLRKIFELGSRATRENLIKLGGIPSSGDLSNKLNELEESGFLKSYLPFGAQKNKRIYAVSDYYTLFYLKFIEHSGPYQTGQWISRLDDPAIRAWQGLAFEQVCWDHLPQIKKELGISGVYTEISTWFRKGNEAFEGAQVDLVIDRKDRIINLLEIKFSINPFEITKAYDLKLRNKVGRFMEAIKQKKAVFLVMITTYGLVKNEYARSIVQNEITMDHLFEP